MKYIIDMSDEYVMESALYGKELAIPLCVNGNDKSFYLPTRLKVEAFTEHDRKAIEDEVWEFATICTKMNGADSVDVFGGFSPDSFIKCSYQEAKTKYEAWKKQKDEIHVGDEVIYHGNKYIVVYVGADEVYHIVDQNWLRVVIQGEYQIFKTDRHFPEVTELLKKMRGEE